MSTIRSRRRNRPRSPYPMEGLFDHPLRWERAGFDPVILGVVVALALTGLVMIFSASGVLAESHYRESTHYLQRQALWLGLGFLVLCVVARQDYGVWRSLTLPLVVGSVGLLVLVLMIGVHVNGARRWLSILGVSFQPSEFAKVAVILYLAAYLHKIHPSQAGWLEGVVRPACVVGAIAGLVVAEPDFGNAVLIGLVFAGMLFLAGVRVRYLLTLGLAILPVLAFLIWRSPERVQRVFTFLDPYEHAESAGYQLVQSFVAFGKGGWMGVGLGHGKQKLFYLPEGHTDFVLALIGEELGLLGTATLIVLYGLLVFKGFQVAAHAPDAFGRYVAQGVTLLIGGQALINAGVVSGLLPTKGLTLPLVSYGGSSAVMSLLALGILLSVAGKRSSPS